MAKYEESSRQFNDIYNKVEEMINATNILLKFAEAEELPAYIIKSQRQNSIRILDYVSDLDIEM